MKLLCWNCRGLGQASTVRTARDLVRQHGANLIFLMETRCCLNKLRDLGLNLGFKFYSGVDPVGSSGGLWVAWDGKYLLSFVCKCDNFYSVFKVVDERGLEWGLCLMYGHPVLSERKRVWDLLGEFEDSVNGGG